MAMRKSPQIVSLAFILHSVSFALAVAAAFRITHATAQRVSGNAQTFTCEFHRATTLGAASAIFLAAGQLFLLLSTKCRCCPCPPKAKVANICTIILCIFSWTMFLFAEIFILVGSSRVNLSMKKVKRTSFHDCKAARQEIFGIGAAFAFLTAIASMAYYVCYNKAAQRILHAAGPV
ncbi:uncharacterized protein LOC9649843 [Selaginella moellendorffii]|uniref:uncharacterized protein LOC9649843 n=1 Tax=Selaginella moellendorffii TaxID=88036 RepID=UPI000D1CD858|nr:uncharacterized protein LOC9649843 [Selaginella moellendorffii]|eukprot:XP_024516034.1 uncharacterized protein LOC9649843 [Selaginella moellendorffii]